MYLEEVPLPGGDVTEGVVRVGDTVRRPLGEHSPTVHLVLRHLESVGFDGAPRLLGVDRRQREILSFIEGEVALRPWPQWVADPGRAISVARLLRRLDDALLLLGLPVGTAAAPLLPGAPPPTGPQPQFLGHRDLTPDNTIFRGGEAAALVDFDMLRPSSRVDEVANLLLWWGGWRAPEDRDDVFAGVDVAARGRLLVDAYALDAADRAFVVPVSVSLAERGWFAMRERAGRLGGGWQRMWDEGAGDAMRRRGRWLREAAVELTGALVD